MAIIPEIHGYSEQKPFRFWVQHVLPLVYEDSLSYYELLCKVVNYINSLIEDNQHMIEDIEALRTALVELKQYVDDYMDNLNYRAVIIARLNEMAEDGTLSRLMAPFLTDAARSDPLYNIMLSQQARIGCLGDSLTYGADFTGDNTGQQAADNYPTVLQNRIVTLAANSIVHNYGRSGYPSADWSVQYASALADFCNICIFMFGANDLRLGYGLDEIVGNAQDFIRTCKSDNIVPIVCSTPPYMSSGQPDRYANGQLIADALKNVCAQEGARYVPVYEELQTFFQSGGYNTIKLLWPDGVHFSTYRPLADIICAHAFPMLLADNHGAILNACRNGGLTTENTTIITAEQAISPNGLLMSLHSNSVWRLNFYSNKPFYFNFLCAEYAGSAEVNWRLTGPVQSDAIPWGVSTGQVGYTIDHYRAGHSTMDAICRNRFFPERAAFAPGFYTVSMYSLTRGDAPDAYTPSLALSAIEIVPVDPILVVAE